MSVRFGVTLTLLAATLMISLDRPRTTPAQDGGPKQKKKKDQDPARADEKILKGIEKALNQSESERDRFLKELSKAYPQAANLPPAADNAAEFSQWFELLSRGGKVWRRDELAHKSLRAAFERIAGRLDIRGDEITREQFRAYAEQYLRPGDSPPLKPPKQDRPFTEAEKTFRQFDRNGDGVLAPDEMPATLRAELRRWDANGDGVIDPQEYAAFFLDLLRRADRARGAPAPEPEDASRPVVYHAGKLPRGLPGWFEQLDTDGDGQVGLYEWRKSGRPIDEFCRMDANGDGFITPEEALRYMAWQAQHPAGEEATLTSPVRADGTLDVREKESRPPKTSKP